MRPYALTGHIHEREAGYHLSRLLLNREEWARVGSEKATGPGGGDAEHPLQVNFIPAVAPWFSGIISTLSVPLRKKMAARDVLELYRAAYKGERLVTVKEPAGGVVEVKDVMGKQGWTVGGIQTDARGERVVVVGGLDNLLKGAATQCLQNLNLALGLEEFAGIPMEENVEL